MLSYRSINNEKQNFFEYLQSNLVNVIYSNPNRKRDEVEENYPDNEIMFEETKEEIPKINKYLKVETINKEMITNEGTDLIFELQKKFTNYSSQFIKECLKISSNDRKSTEEFLENPENNYKSNISYN